MPAKILAVDDDPDILDALTMILEGEGNEVVTARDGIQALVSIKAEKPDLMILDLLMPKMDGFGVCKELQDPSWIDFKDMPILVLSSVREDACRRRYQLETSLEFDIDDYIEKPFDPKMLVQRVERLLKRKKKG
jgi:DNA-binding response OmpR family regulator